MRGCRHCPGWFRLPRSHDRISRAGSLVRGSIKLLISLADSDTDIAFLEKRGGSGDLAVMHA